MSATPLYGFLFVQSASNPTDTVAFSEALMSHPVEKANLESVQIGASKLFTVLLRAATNVMLSPAT